MYIYDLIFIVCMNLISSIKNVGYFKVIVILLSFGLQLLFILRLFNNSGKVVMSDEDRNNPFFASQGL